MPSWFTVRVMFFDVLISGHPGLWKLKKLWGCRRVESTELFALHLIFVHSRKLTYAARKHLPFWWYLFKDSWWSYMYSVWVLSMARLVYQRVYIYHTTGIFFERRLPTSCCGFTHTFLNNMFTLLPTPWISIYTMHGWYGYGRIFPYIWLQKWINQSHGSLMSIWHIPTRRSNSSDEHWPKLRLFRVYRGLYRSYYQVI